LRCDVGGHELRLEVEGSGPPWLVCLHGLVDTLEVWDRLAPALARRGAVARFDQRGHGESGAPPGPYRREDLVSDVVGVLEGLGVPRAILVGHSMGGVVALTMGLTRPERVAGMVLLGTASQCSERVAAWYERIALAGETEGCEGIARAIYGESSRRRVAGDPRALAHVTRTLKSLWADPLTPKLSEIRCPVLLIVGEKDPMGPRASEIIAEQVPGARVEVLPGRGHWTHVEAPDAVLERIEGWLREEGLAG
jgi:3-oxoadipate enol-lactonase